MIGLDTNVLVRYLAQDDKIQSGKATKFIEKRITEKDPGYINCVVLVETAWVLETCYGANKQAIANVIQQLVSTKQLVLQEAEIVLRSLRIYESSKIDFADALLSTINSKNGCDTTMTFDKKAGDIASFTLLR